MQYTLAVGCMICSYFTMPMWFLLMECTGHDTHTLSGIICMIIVATLKHIVPKQRPSQRQRVPDLGFEHVNPMHSFPSGDVAQAAVIWMSVEHYYLGLLLVVSSAVGRLYYRRHDLVDIIGGITCGVAAHIIACTLIVFNEPL